MNGFSIKSTAEVAEDNDDGSGHPFNPPVDSSAPLPVMPENPFLLRRCAGAPPWLTHPIRTVIQGKKGLEGRMRDAIESCRNKRQEMLGCAPGSADHMHRRERLVRELDDVHLTAETIRKISSDPAVSNLRPDVAHQINAAIYAAVGRHYDSVISPLFREVEQLWAEKLPGLVKQAREIEEAANGTLRKLGAEFAGPGPAVAAIARGNEMLGSYVKEWFRQRDTSHPGLSMLPQVELLERLFDH